MKNVSSRVDRNFQRAYSSFQTGYGRPLLAKMSADNTLGSLAAELAVDEPDAANSEDSAHDLRMGAVVRAFRGARGWPIAELASRTGLSVGMISQIERGLSTPSLRSLRLLSAALEAPIAHFFDPPTTTAAPVSPHIVRVEDRQSLQLNKTGVVKMSLVPPGGETVEMWEFRIAPNGSSGGDLLNQEGEKAGVVLAGRINLWIDNTPTVLKIGDSFRFSSLLQYKLENPFKDEARIIWVVTPPIRRA